MVEVLGLKLAEFFEAQPGESQGDEERAPDLGIRRGLFVSRLLRGLTAV
jgi:hypothetical protein